MTIQHPTNKGELYHNGILDIIHHILKTQTSHREIIRFTLLTLFNLLDNDSSSKYSVAQARQKCLLLGLMELILPCETSFAEDRDIVESVRRIGQFLYSNYS